MPRTQDLISIIIPIYNVEKFLAECVESAIHQTYKHLEIILVDDGSPDNSGKIADDYAKKDKRIKVIHKKNGGLFDARNAGLSKIHGDYVMFLDSDDYLSTNCISTLHNIAKNNDSDIVCGEITSDPGKLNKLPKKNPVTTNLPSEEALEMFFYMKIKNNVAAKLYRTNTVAGLLFPSTTFAEDQEYNFDAINKSTKITTYSGIVYYYRSNPDSLTRATFNKKRMLGLTAVERNLQKSKKHSTKIQTAAINRQFAEAYFILETILFSNAKHKFMSDYLAMKKILKKSSKKVLANTAAPPKLRLIALSSIINVDLLPQMVKLIR